MQTTTTTTTIETESMFLDHLETRFPEPAGFSCEETCPHCERRFVAPEAPLLATDHNGVQLADVCFEGSGDGLHRVFVIGDWGGILSGSTPKPADDRSGRPFVHGVDDVAQHRVADAMQARASRTHPDYILNGGDNFYWGGVSGTCGNPDWKGIPSLQFRHVFEDMYRGPGLDDVPWLGVLGNHDYGGFLFTAAWDQAIGYTWSKSGRWMTPAQYWRVKVHYPGFSVDYYFADTNVVDSGGGAADPMHSICNTVHNSASSSCGAEGPSNGVDCTGWFQKLWADQKVWLEDALSSSAADWQVVVTHFPPTAMADYWADMCDRHGIDLFVSGHVHQVELHHLEASNFLRPTAWVISGGGGGITSKGMPTLSGHDAMYGFVELTLTAKEIEIIGISHGGIEMFQTFLLQREPAKPRHPKEEA